MEHTTSYTPASTEAGLNPVTFPQHSAPNEAHSSAIHWAAVFGGALATAALSLILLALGTGLGLSSVSPWAGVGASASALGTGAIAWLIAMQVLAASMGGYIAGRARTKWTRIHGDEVHFRDTMHGFLAWSLATVLTAGLLASAALSMLGTAATAAAAASDHNATATYYLDTMFRTERPSPDVNDTAMRAEAGRIFANVLRNDDAPASDRAYLSSLVAARTGMSPADADQRVSAVIAQAKQAADTARKAASHASLWIFVALLIGAFCASCTATLGGRQRDNVVII